MRKIINELTFNYLAFKLLEGFGLYKHWQDLSKMHEPCYIENIELKEDDKGNHKIITHLVIVDDLKKEDFSK